MVSFHNIGFKTWATEIFNILKAYNLEKNILSPSTEANACQNTSNCPAKTQGNISNKMEPVHPVNIQA